MELLSVLAVLRRRRALVLAGLLPALLAGAMVAGRLPVGPGSSPGQPFGVAQVRLLVDHGTSARADLAAPSQTLGDQAAVLAELMGGDVARARIAAAAGVPVAALGLQRAALLRPVAPGELPERAGPAAALVARPVTVDVRVATPLPVLSVDVRAPTRAAAARVAAASGATLARLAAERAPEPGRAIAVRPLGGVRAGSVVPQPRGLRVGLLAALVLLLAWAVAVVLAHGLLRAWDGLGAGPPAPPSRPAPADPGHGRRSAHSPRVRRRTVRA